MFIFYARQSKFVQVHENSHRVGMILMKSHKFVNLLLKNYVYTQEQSHKFVISLFQITGNGSHISANACNVAFPV